MDSAITNEELLLMLKNSDNDFCIGYPSILQAATDTLLLKT